MATDSGYERGNYLRVCDICGHRFHFKDLKPIGELKFACKDDAPGLTATQISRFNAKARPLVVKPNKYAKDYIQVPTYQHAEGELFNHVLKVAPAELPDGDNSPEAAAWTALYMAKILLEERRPTIWECDARCKLAECSAYLLSLQYGSSTGPSATSDDPKYGGVLVGTVCDTTITIVAGIAFIYAYRATSVSSYLDAADRVATFLRHAQCGDLQVTAYTVYPSGTARYHVGGFARGYDTTVSYLLDSYDVCDVLGCWFLDLLGEERGTSTEYGDAAATSFFTAKTKASIATMLSELTAFAETGPKDTAASGAAVTGLSTTAPRETYVAATNGGSGTATWTSQTNVASRPLGMAIRGLYEAGGNTAKVAAMMAWLAAFTANSANATPAALHPEAVLQGITGTYDPAVCPADNLKASAPFTESTGARYDWATFGLLAPVLIAQTTDLRASKDALSKVRRYSTKDIGERYLGPIGVSGLDFQPWANTTPLSGQRSVTAAAMVSLAYREQPGRFPMRPESTEVCDCTGDPAGKASLFSSGGGSGVLAGAFWHGIAGTGISFYSGNLVQQINDQSIQGNHVTKIASALVGGPEQDNNIQNGRPGLRFREIGSYQFNACQAPFGTGLPPADSAMTIYTVCRPVGSNIGGPLFSLSFQNGEPHFIAYLFETGGTQYGYGDGITGSSFAAVVNYTDTNLVVAHYTNGSGIWCDINGTERALTPATVTPANVASNGFVVGGRMPFGFERQGFEGYIFEQVAYAQNLRNTVADVNMKAYLHSEWGF